MTMAAAALASAASGMTVAAPRSSMAYHKLGSSDLMVSSCCLGARASPKVPDHQKCPSPQVVPLPTAREARPLGLSCSVGPVA